MQPPGNYNDESMVIKVDPVQMYRHAMVDMINHAQTVGDALTSINGIWNDLKVGWVGATADEAQDFNDQWSAAMTGLFGSSDGTASGAIGKIASAVATAATNYGVAEDTNIQNIRAFSQSLLSGSSAGHPLAPIRGENQPPITENNQP